MLIRRLVAFEPNFSIRAKHILECFDILNPFRKGKKGKDKDKPSTGSEGCI
jgi:hypothetical protein